VRACDGYNSGGSTQDAPGNDCTTWLGDPLLSRLLQPLPSNWRPLRCLPASPPREHKARRQPRQRLLHGRLGVTCCRTAAILSTGTR